MVTQLLLTGAARPLGRRVAALAAVDPTVKKITAVDTADFRPLLDGWPASGPELEWHRRHLAGLDLQELVGGIDAVVHLAAPSEDAAAAGIGSVDVAGTRALFESLGEIEALVLISSATVYGAWATNPIPLTESAPLRPNPDFAGVENAELERLASEWHRAHRATSLAVLRPTLTLSEDSLEWMARSVWGAVGIRAGDVAPPSQFLHLDDLAAAVDLVRRTSASGTFNVAPDGWIPSDALAGLRGAGPRFPVPEAVATRLARLAHRMSLSSTPEGAVPYTAHPWVVANDRLRSLGWVPEWSNEETFVAGTRAAPWASLDARRRQELGLAAAALGSVAVAFGGAALTRRVLRGSSAE